MFAAPRLIAPLPVVGLSLAAGTSAHASGESLYVRGGPIQAYTCKWKLERTATSAPVVPTSCP